MSEIVFDEEGFKEFQDVNVAQYMFIIVNEEVVDSVRNHAHGRPGPNIITGDLYNHVHATPVEEVVGAFDVSSDAVHNGVNYPSLLEFGFTSRAGNEVGPFPFLVPGLRALFGADMIENPASS